LCYFKEGEGERGGEGGRGRANEKEGGGEVLNM